MLVALDRVGCMEPNSPAIRAGCPLNLSDRALAVCAIGHNDVIGEAVLTLYDEIPLPSLEA